MPQSIQLLFILAISLRYCTSTWGFEVGNIASDLKVDQGKAVYTLPIETPKGFPTNLLKLEIEYNSGSRNGPIGLGWTLKGLSEISR